MAEITLERVDGEQKFTWSYGYETYRSENGVIVIPATMATAMAIGAVAGTYQVVQQEPPVPVKAAAKKKAVSEETD